MEQRQPSKGRRCRNRDYEADFRGAENDKGGRGDDCSELGEDV